MGIKEEEILGVSDKRLFSRHSNYYHYFFLVLIVLSFSSIITVIILLILYSDIHDNIGLIVSSLLMGLFVGSFSLAILIINSKAVKQVKFFFSNKDYPSLIELLSTKDDKQKSEFMSLYAALALGDLLYKDAIDDLVKVLLSEWKVSWGRRRAFAHALAKIGTIESVRALNQAYYLFSNPYRSMRMGSRFEFFHIYRTKRKVKILLSTIAKINHNDDLAEFNANFGIFTNDF
ncbi:MAG: HEAT repeat domain-containing protein [Candidatus Heimdallarchaeota archaeon]|nr:HEAT repeat domain-containing protein [Candidatus Heimdallarchaeota archaeon]